MKRTPLKRTGPPERRASTTDDPKYPQYRVSLTWVQDGEHDERYPKRYDGLPPGRIRNSTSFTRMYREDPGIAEVEREAREEVWPKVRDKERRIGGPPIGELNPSDLEVEVRGPEWETWALSWFEHWTFDVGQSDEEALASFERYVRRYEHMQDFHLGDMPEGYRCLMGAQDRWRWTGAGPDGDSESQSEPPCRCKHCKEQGVIRIGH